MDGEKLITICALLGLAVAAVAAFLAIGKHKNLSDVIRIAGAGVFVTVLILVYPYYAAGEGPYALWISLFHAMCAMLMNAGPSEIIDALSAYAVPFIGVYNAAVLALHIIAPLFTLGILSLGSEKRNLDTAIIVRRFYGLRDGFSKIHILTDHKTTDEQLLPLDEVQGGVYQDKLRRSHARICASATKELSEKLGRDFENEDRISCRRLPDILALANALSGVKMSAVPLKKQPVKEAENHV